jgi:trimeric autotransporter adhesin
MRFANTLILQCTLILLVCTAVNAQQADTSTAAVVPRLVNFSGQAIQDGKIITGPAGATFAIYNEESGGSALWLETQSIQSDAKGNYTVQLGATKPGGLPLDLFASGEARWLGVSINGGQEQPRVLLLSVPYALKAADSQTLGGLPASAFVLAAPASGGSVADGSANSSGSAAALQPALAGNGTADYIPLWTPNGSTLGDSVLFQTGTGSSAKIGINTTTPAATLDVSGGETVRGLLNLPPAGTATASLGVISRPFGLVAQTFNSGSSTTANQAFHWQAEPVGNNTSSPSASLNLLFGTAPAAAAETGLKIASNGQITFAPGQTFPGTGGTGTITGVTAGTDLTGGGTSGNVTLNLNTGALNSTYAQLSAANTFSANQTMNGNLSVAGSVSAGPISVVTSSGYSAVYGNDQSSGGSVGVQGNSTNGTALYGNSTNGLGVYGASGSSYGVLAVSNGIAVYGSSASTSDLSDNYGVYGTGPIGVGGSSSTEDGIGMFGSGSNVGVEAYGATGVYSVGSSTGVSGTGTGWGVYGTSASADGVGGGFYNTSTGDALFAENQTKGSYAAFFLGNVDVDGSFSNAAEALKIDDPLDPANKYLYHSSVESPDMKNIYDGTVTTDGSGLATVTLPDWFEVLNRDFRYQLTVIGQFSQAIVASEVSNNQFTIKTDKPNVKVSWQVTGIRQDAWANANRIPVEAYKAAADQGLYLHPELFGAPADRSIALAHHPTPKLQKPDPKTLKLPKQQAIKLKFPMK